MKTSTKKKKEYRLELSFLDIALIFLATTFVLFIITMTIIFCIKDSVPDSLIEMYRDIVVAEITAGGIIQIAKARKKQKEKTASQNGEEQSDESEEDADD